MLKGSVLRCLVKFWNVDNLLINFDEFSDNSPVVFFGPAAE